MIKGNFIENLRKKHNLSQEHLAKELGISRPTYMQVEKGERELTITEAQKIADIFGLTLNELIAGKKGKKNIDVQFVKDEGGPKYNAGEKLDIRISVPQKKLDKFREVLLYVLEKVGAKPNVGETVIYKLLYFIDFDYYEKYEEQLIGASYMKNHHGPTPVEFEKIIEKMEANNEIMKVKSKFFQYEQRKYLPLKHPDLKKLSAQEISHIDDVLNRLAGKTAKELSEYSHGDVPWKSHKNGEVMDYESVFYRDDKYSVREYGDEL